MINFFNTHISKNAIASVSHVLNSTFVSEGAVVKKFERQLSSNLGLLHPVAVNSGTSALHLALILAGVKPGDEVILPAQTFVASALAVKYVAAKPIFADIEYETGNIDVVSLKRKVTHNTKAILIVHWAGNPCNISEIQKIADQYNIPIIEDAAHALGGTYCGHPIGTISSFTCFSFQAIKHLTTGDGGAICCSDAIHMADAKKLRWFGIDRENTEIGELGERNYNLNEIGYKYHMNDFSAALGLSNLESFKDRLSYVRWIDHIYRENFTKVSGITPFRKDHDRESACWLFGIHVDHRDEFIEKMKRCKIPVSVVHQRIDRNFCFGGLCNDLEQQERFDKTQIHLPIHSGLTEKQVEYIIKQVKEG